LPGPMVLRLKARESRSSPGLPKTGKIPFIHNTQTGQAHKPARFFNISLPYAAQGGAAKACDNKPTKQKYRAALNRYLLLVTRGGAAPPVRPKAEQAKQKQTGLRSIARTSW
ncbi:MAG: hypothetical protein ACTHLA_02330, partial [Asticcacaulis sp.]|uniref:hypothetical protein n=1 Tax=Asticcacaulis sp. TaxID=1872648 RepID=UPI003F7C460F